MVSTYSSRTSLATWRSLVIRNSLKILHTRHTDITQVMSTLCALGYVTLIGHEKLTEGSAHTSYWCHHKGDEHSECIALDISNGYWFGSVFHFHISLQYNSLQHYVITIQYHVIITLRINVYIIVDPVSVVHSPLPRHSAKEMITIVVTQCICTLCLCCCTPHVTLSISVSRFLFCWVWRRIMMSFICNNSFTYVLRIIILEVSKTVQEKARGNNNGLSHVPSNRKEEIKSGTFGCGSFVVPYFQPATSIDRLHYYYYFWRF